MSGNKEQVTQDKSLDLQGDIERVIARITHPKKRLFLDNFQVFGEVSKAAEATGVCRRTAYVWLSNDEVFSTAFEAVKKVAERELLEKHLKNIREIAFDPEVKPGARLVASFFEVKKLDPSYRDRLAANNTFIREIVVHSAIPWPKYDDEPIQVAIEPSKQIESAST